ncbi:transcriptional regulator [Leptospira ryugenii]|uniref:Transcriptional regulator n=1 Tax=Leptospira ryugenii TaxID=1917863 RepID=A0A2P2DZU9_9LEPT|nr:FMN-binding negative transcriptional regulator [Leptospira ryugenii]GBF50164.1 transcriptional regulator [Leptospira ryugenii]
MFLPASFQSKDPNFPWKLIQENPFGTLVNFDGNSLLGTHIPFLISPDRRYLYAHLAKANPQWQTLSEREGMAIFLGPHHYISPTWYETPQTVPTWNYMAVHVYGHLTLVSDLKEVLQSLLDLVDEFEGKNSSYHLSNLEDSTLQKLTMGIVAIRMEITKVDAKAKLSQNHPEERKRRVIEALQSIGTENAVHIAKAMESALLGLI